MITNKNYDVDLASLADKKILFDFAEEMNYDVRGHGRKSTRGRSLVVLIESPAIMASGISTIVLSSDPDELCHRLKLLLQEKQAENNSDIIDKEIIFYI